MGSGVEKINNDQQTTEYLPKPSKGPPGPGDMTTCGPPSPGETVHPHVQTLLPRHPVTTLRLSLGSNCPDSFPAILSCAALCPLGGIFVLLLNVVTRLTGPEDIEWRELQLETI